MVTTHLPRLRLNNKTLDDGVFKLLSIVKPEWVRGEIQVKDYSRGGSCLVYKCFTTKTEASIIIKVFNTSDDTSLSGSFEHEALKEVSRIGEFPRILAVFANGYVYTFIPGKAIFTAARPPLDMEEEKLKKIAKCMCRIHSLKVDGVTYTRTDYFLRLRKVLETVYEEKPELPDKTTLRKELDQMEEMIHRLHLALPLTLCHGNAHPGNMIWNNDQRRVTFVDWELVHVGYQAAEVAYFLQKLKLLATYLNFPNTIPINFEDIFLTCYLQHWFEMTERKATNVNETDFNDFKAQVMFFKPIVNLSFIIMSSIYDEDVDTIGEGEHDIELAKKIFEEYLELKNEVYDGMQ